MPEKTQKTPELCTRSPICVVVGHVDHGKTSILDRIRNTSIVNTEAGKITQAIGASIVPLATIKKVCKDALAAMKMNFTIPGLLFIDTPGHAAFINLRKRGGNIADIAILVVDINEGFMPQTIEAIEILRSYKTPFIIAANKIDLIHGWKKNVENNNKDDDKKNTLAKNIALQTPQVQELIDKKLYELVGKLFEVSQMQSERFDRVNDFTKQIAIVPCSAQTGEGIPELLMFITGLAQRFLEKNLLCDVKGDAAGTILEVKHDKGLGTTIDVIIHEGKLAVNDILVIGGLEKPIVTKVKALLIPTPLAEMRDRKTKFNAVKQVNAATGVKISAMDIDEAIAGMPIRSCSKNELVEVTTSIQEEVEEVIVNTDNEGIVIKADTLGSLEALQTLLRQHDIKIKKAGVGNIAKKDIIDAEANYTKSPLISVVLGFNVKDESGLCNEHVKILIDNIIYKLIEDFQAWQILERKNLEKAMLSDVVMPCKLKFLPGYVFRQNNPAVVGIEVLAGKLVAGISLMKKDTKDGKAITKVSAIQVEKESATQVEAGKQAAVSMGDVTVGRQIHEGDIFYSCIPEHHFRKLKELKHLLSENEKNILKEIAEIMRKVNPVWGV
ncbi:TPA: translation initiation factor IF-2 [Candidatus Woesearchaeota archaeon]|nr:translation initiation factor IF-2 [Candidatus Woesearchaeota archaeon]